MGRAFFVLAAAAVFGGAVLLANAVTRAPAAATSPTLSPEQLDARARSIAAAKLDVPVDETVIYNMAVATYPISGASARSYKIGTARKYGKLEPQLADALAKVPAAQRLPVVFELVAVRPALPLPPVDTADAARIAWNAEVARLQDQAYRPAVTSFVEVLAQSGIAGQWIGGSAVTMPWVYASCTPDQIRALAGRSEVRRVSAAPGAAPN